MHNPDSHHGFVASALGSSLIHFYKDKDGEWKTEVVEKIPPYEVEGWALPSLPALITDFVISLDDRFLYLSNWLHGIKKFLLC